MKKLAGMAVIAAAAVMAGSGASLAAEKQESKAPVFGTKEYNRALETGNLPSDPKLRVQENKSLSDAQTPTVEIGGRLYRIGIDDGP